MREMMHPSPSHPPRRFRTWLTRALLLTLSLLVGLFLVELVLFLTHSPARIHEQVANPPNLSLQVDQLEYRYLWRTNDRGLRYRTVPARKPRGSRRVFVVGDSFVDGEGVSDEERFTQRLEHRFSRQDRPVEFINGGLGGQAALQYARAFLWIGLRYEPDGLLIAVNANDVADTDPSASVDEVYGIEKLPSTTTGRLFRSAWPRLWCRLRQARDALGQDPRRGWEEEPFELSAMRAEAHARGIPQARIRAWEERLPREWIEAAKEGRLAQYLLTWGLFRPHYLLTSIDIAGREAQARWRAQAGLLSEIVHIARRHEIRIGVVFLPSAYLYDARSRDPQNRFPFSYLGGVTQERWLTEQTEIQRRMERWAALEQVPYLDLTDPFREAAAAGARLQYDLDGHWNAEGHRLAADSLAAWIEGERVFPGLTGADSPLP